MNRVDFRIQVPLFRSSAGVKSEELRKLGFYSPSWYGARRLEAMRGNISSAQIGGKCYGN
jgi:hypothetical protein